jgi:hypothetical protein
LKVMFMYNTHEKSEELFLYKFQDVAVLKRKEFVPSIRKFKQTGSLLDVKKNNRLKTPTDN